MILSILPNTRLGVDFFDEVEDGDDDEERGAADRDRKFLRSLICCAL